MSEKKTHKMFHIETSEPDGLTENFEMMRWEETHRDGSRQAETAAETETKKSKTQRTWLPSLHFIHVELL